MNDSAMILSALETRLIAGLV